MTRKGADIVVEAFKKEGVEVIFGYPGGVILDTFDKMNLAVPAFKFVQCRHEQGGSFMADGYARVTGRPGVLVVTSGPGATNVITGLANAYMDSIPMVVITGQVPTTAIGNDAFQEVDITGITRPVTKHNYLVKDVRDLPQILKEAFYLASTGRPGPVLVDLPKDVQRAECDVPYPDTVAMPTYRPTFEGNMNQVKKLADAIKRAKRPVAYVGGGVIHSNASKELHAFIKKTRMPVTTTLMALGAYPQDEPENLMMLGMHGTKFANYAVQECDLLLSIGARFDDRVTGKTSEFAPKAVIAHIDIDPTSISKSVTADLPVVGDVKDVLQKLNQIVEPADISEWLNQVAEWKEKHPLRFPRNGAIMPQEVLVTLDGIVKGEAIITTDVGQHQMWAAQYLHFKRPRTWLTSGGLGSMGYGLPSAIGAQVAAPDSLVFSINGDGGFQMCASELTTASINRLPVISIVLNNGYLGMVRQWQELFYKKNYAMSCMDRHDKCPWPCNEPGTQCPVYTPDLVKLAEAHACHGQRITRREDIEGAIRAAIDIAKNERRPSVLEFMVEREVNVYPMVPAGARLDDMVDSLA
ncbi:biosynthetic-type acetolactate synthase large subunit [bacterium]|nr:biosynthetic-type acetolactate synthase large subunit [bacterium]